MTGCMAPGGRGFWSPARLLCVTSQADDLTHSLSSWTFGVEPLSLGFTIKTMGFIEPPLFFFLRMFIIPIGSSILLAGVKPQGLWWETKVQTLFGPLRKEDLQRRI